MSVGDLDDTTRSLDERRRRQGSLSALEVTRVTVSSRPHWYQVTMYALGSAELAERMREIARADWQRYKGFRRIEVTAADNLGHVSSYVVEPWPGVCPHCGRSL